MGNSNETRRNHLNIGKIGEDLACNFLIKKGYFLVKRNYLKKYGEIDLIVKKEGRIYFVEVKSVSCGTFLNVVHKTDGFRAEDNIHLLKILRLKRVLSVFIVENSITDWQFDVITVYIDTKSNKALINHLENIVL